jgi:hypothetical protein
MALELVEHRALRCDRRAENLSTPPDRAQRCARSGHSLMVVDGRHRLPAEMVVDQGVEKAEVHRELEAILDGVGPVDGYVDPYDEPDDDDDCHGEEWRRAH